MNWIDFWMGFTSGMIMGLSMLLPLYAFIIQPAIQRFMDKIIEENRP